MSDDPVIIISNLYSFNKHALSADCMLGSKLGTLNTQLLGWVFFFQLVYNGFQLVFFFQIVLQCCVGFCHTTMWISFIYIYMYPLPLEPPCSHIPSYPFRSSQRARLGSLCYITTPHYLSVLHTMVYICWCYFLHLSHSLPPTLCAQVHSPSLHLHSIPADRFIGTIFLSSSHPHLPLLSPQVRSLLGSSVPLF